MSKKEVYILITAILLSVSMPKYFEYVSNMKGASDNHDTNAMTENFSEYSFNIVQGELIGKIIFVLVSIILSILGLFGLLKKSGAI